MTKSMEKSNDKQGERFLIAFFCLIVALAASVSEFISSPRRGFRLIVPITPDDVRFND